MKLPIGRRRQDFTARRTDDDVFLRIDQAVDAFDLWLRRKRHAHLQDGVVGCRNGWRLVFQSDTMPYALGGMIRIVPPLRMLGEAALRIFEQLAHRYARLHAFDDLVENSPHTVM